MKTKTIVIPTIQKVDFKIECLNEHIPVKGNALASGDDDEDRKEENRIINDLESNPWAWCTVKMTASWKGLDGIDYLGGCSYKSERDFIQNSGYYQDMKKRAYSDLMDKINALCVGS